MPRPLNRKRGGPAAIYLDWSQIADESSHKRGNFILLPHPPSQFTRLSAQQGFWATSLWLPYTQSGATRARGVRDISKSDSPDSGPVFTAFGFVYLKNFNP